MQGISLAGRSILIVEDEPLVALDLRSAFEKGRAPVSSRSTFSPTPSVITAITRSHRSSRNGSSSMSPGFARFAIASFAIAHSWSAGVTRPVTHQLSLSVEQPPGRPTRTALLPCDPIAFIGKPVLPILLQRALQKAEGLTER
jgi:hypothetical protein